jgi:Tetratricopeptide repeat
MNRLQLVFLSLLFAVTLPLTAATDAQLAVVAAHIQKGDTTTARAELDRLLKAEPDDATLKALRAQIGGATPQIASADAPTLEQTIEWLKERLVGHTLAYTDRVDNVRFKDGWLYITTTNDVISGCRVIYAVAFSSLDAQCLSRLEKKSDEIGFSINATGKWPIQSEINCNQGSSSTSNIRAVTFMSKSGREDALKFAKAFDHAARLSGGGQKDLF